MKIFGVNISVPSVPVPKAARRELLAHALRDYLRCDYDSESATMISKTILTEIEQSVAAHRGDSAALAVLASTESQFKVESK
jgi:hypothetical protein